VEHDDWLFTNVPFAEMNTQLWYYWSYWNT